MLLTDLNNDTLIYILSFLEPFQLLGIRKACAQLHALTHSRIVWTNACKGHVIRRGFPFPNVTLDSLSLLELEQYTCRGSQLATKWLSHEWTPSQKWSIDATTNMSVTSIRFVPGSKGTVVFTLSKIVWSVVTVWELRPVIANIEKGGGFRRCCEWSPRGAIAVFNGFALNSCSSARAKLAISVINQGKQTVELLSLEQEIPGNLMLRSIKCIPTTLKPVALEGDMLAICDDVSETIIFNWKTGAYATLQNTHDGQGVRQIDNCIQVVFAYQSIVVVRARSIHLFPYPVLRTSEEGALRYTPVARYSFGWVDGVSVKMTGPRQTSLTDYPNRLQSLSIFIRAETDDPWSSDTLNLELYTLNPNPNYTPSNESSEPQGENPEQMISPYVFPPTLISKVNTLRGAVRCTDVVLGSLGTAVWIQPRDRSAVGLYWSADDAPPGHVPRMENMNESLVAAAFPGTLAPLADLESDREPVTSGGVVETKGRTICVNESNDWSSLDYDEDVGRVILGSSFGQITVLDM